jgi:hypothetical protein
VQLLTSKISHSRSYSFIYLVEERGVKNAHTFQSWIPRNEMQSKRQSKGNHDRILCAWMRILQRKHSLSLLGRVCEEAELDRRAVLQGPPKRRIDAPQGSRGLELGRGQSEESNSLLIMRYIGVIRANKTMLFAHTCVPLREGWRPALHCRPQFATKT